LRELVARLALAAGERKAASRSGLLSEKDLRTRTGALIRGWAKPAVGSEGANVTPFPNAKFRPCMPVGERRKIGRLVKASIPEWSRTERFDPEG